MSESSVIKIEKPAPPAIVKELQPMVDTAQLFKVVDLDTHGASLYQVKQLRMGERRIHELFEPSRKAAEAAKKEIIALRDGFIGPIKQARLFLEESATIYYQAEERKAAEKQRELEAQARKEEEERKLREVDAALEAGETKEAEAIIEEPVEVPQVAVAPPVAFVKGVSQRKTYGAEVVSLSALVKYVYENPAWVHLLQPSMTTLNSIARSQREAFKIPGVKLVVKSSMAVRG